MKRRGIGIDWRHVIALPIAAAGVVCGVLLHAQTGDFALRQYESGLVFMQNQRYAEGIKDFQTVVDSFPQNPIADDALLQIAMYQTDVAHDVDAARKTTDRLLKEYPESNSAPMGYVLAGRLTLARGRTAADVDTALASFERVPRLFPQSDAVAAAWFYAGDTMRMAHRPDEALDRFRRVVLEYPRTVWAARSSLAVAVSLAQSDKVPRAQAELQRIRRQFPDTAEARAALDLNTILYRLYLRPSSQTYQFSGRFIEADSSRYKDVIGLAVDSTGRILLGHRLGVSIFDKATPVSSVQATEPAGFFLEDSSRVFIVQKENLLTERALPIILKVPASDGRSARQVEEIAAAVAFSNGDRLVADRKARVVIRFRPTGDYVSTFASVNARRLAVGTSDEVAIIDRDAKSIVMADRDGKVVARLPAKGTNYELDDPIDLAFDALGNLYVLDGGKAAIYVFRANGVLGASFVSSPKDLNAFQRPRAFTVDAAGRLYVYDERLQKIQVYQ